MQQISNRDTTLDIAKGISILLMTITHLSLFDPFPMVKHFNADILMLFKMPLFIFISGILFSNKHALYDFCSNKFDALIKPILTIFTVTIVAYLLYNGFQYRSIVEAVKDTHRFLYKLYFPLWFPLVLFATLLLFKTVLVVKSKVHPPTFVMLYISLITFLCFVTKYNIQYSLFLGHPILYFFIILSIGYFVKQKQLLAMMYRTDFFIFSVLLLSCYVIQKDILEVKVDLSMNEFGRLIPTSITFITGISIVFYLSKLISKTQYLSKVLIHCSKGSFFILAFHVLIANYILYPFLITRLENVYVASVICFVLTIGGCVLIYQLLFRTKILKYFLLPKKLFK